jgi:tyrosyl-DNA phosphodiesterase 2
VEEFVRLTETDEALAQYYLQDREWDIQRSVNDYFDESSRAAAESGTGFGGRRGHEEKETGKNKSRFSLPPLAPRDDGDEVMIVDIKHGNSSAKKPRTSSSGETSSSLVLSSNSNTQRSGRNSNGFRFITWNIDGINDKNLVLRTNAVCDRIKKEGADIVFLQEVVVESEKIIRERLPEFLMISGQKNGTFNADYFTATLMKRDTVECDSFETIMFRNTSMLRNLLVAKVKISSTRLNLLNTHLESTGEFANVRKQQLSESLKRIVACSGDEGVIFAGDLNLRDKELDAIGGLPNPVIDVWEATGRRKELAFTWDMMRNDNLDFRPRGKGNFKPRFRFDRIFVRDSNPSQIIPEHFGLLGLERLRPHVCFPSDHWGLLCHFRTSR